MLYRNSKTKQEQEVQDFEKTRIAILERAGWRKVEEASQDAQEAPTDVSDATAPKATDTGDKAPSSPSDTPTEEASEEAAPVETPEEAPKPALPKKKAAK